jgi:predicted nucleic acid-binding protein
LAFVLDASITTTWAFDDESDPIADAARNLMAKESAIVPAIWWYEVRNAALVGERRGRLRPTNTEYYLEQLADLPITTDAAVDEALAFRLARNHQLTFYDASYLALALRRHVPLATLDRALVRAARAEGVALVEAQ